MVICGPCWGVGGQEEEGEGRGLSSPALRANAIALPLERVVLGWVRFPGFHNVRRQWAHSCSQFKASRKRRRDTEGSGRGWRALGKGRGREPACPRIQTPGRMLQHGRPRAPALGAAQRGNRGSHREGWGAGGGGRKYCKAKLGEPEDVHSKGRGCFAASEAAGMETPKARTLAVGFAAGSLCGQPGSERRYENVGRGRVLG